MKSIAIMLLLINIMAPCWASAGEFSSLAAGILAMRRRPKPVVPAPVPVSDICENCNGVGKVGDGTIMKTCPECNGTGKRKKPAEPPPVPPAAAEPSPTDPVAVVESSAPPPPGTCRINADGTRTCTPAVSRRRLFGLGLR